MPRSTPARSRASMRPTADSCGPSPSRRRPGGALRQHRPEVARSIGDALNGYEMVLDLVTQARPLTEAWIRRLHEVLCASQEMFTVATGFGLGAAAAQRQTSSHRTTRPTPTLVVSSTTRRRSTLLRRWRGWSRSWRRPSSSRRIRSSKRPHAHPAFVRIHPFADGNGRVARALAAVFLYRRPGVPLVIFADQKTSVSRRSPRRPIRTCRDPSWRSWPSGPSTRLVSCA